MANTTTAVTLPPSESTVISAAGGTRFRIANTTGDALFVRLAAAAAGPTQGGYDLMIPQGLQYFSDLSEYTGEMRAWSNEGGVINVSVDA